MISNNTTTQDNDTEYDDLVDLSEVKIITPVEFLKLSQNSVAGGTLPRRSRNQYQDGVYEAHVFISTSSGGSKSFCIANLKMQNVLVGNV